MASPSVADPAASVVEAIVADAAVVSSCVGGGAGVSYCVADAAGVSCAHGSSSEDVSSEDVNGSLAQNKLIP